jgi:hypothetical protein
MVEYAPFSASTLRLASFESRAFSTLFLAVRIDERQALLRSRLRSVTSTLLTADLILGTARNPNFFMQITVGYSSTAPKGTPNKLSHLLSK